MIVGNLGPSKRLWKTILRTAHHRITPHGCSQTVFGKGAKVIQSGMYNLCNKQNIHMQKNEVGPLPYNIKN